MSLLWVGGSALKDGLVQTREEAFADFVQVLIEAAERHDQAAIDALSVSSRTYEGPVGEGVTTQEELMAELLEAWAGAEETAIVLRSMEQAVAGETGILSAGFRITVKADGERHGFAADLGMTTTWHEEQWLIESLRFVDLRHTRLR
ncbi:MAG: hypothetical protein GY898_16495 [Proteobacteria bacterium]|nr:hypothetical protein [Pseudomonadota bacterium]